MRSAGGAMAWGQTVQPGGKHVNQSQGASLQPAWVADSVPAALRSQLATWPGRLRKKYKASSTDIVPLGAPSPGAKVKTLM